MKRAVSRQFTFAEVLVAMVFVAIVVPVALRGILIANRMGAVAEKKRVAVALADRVLTEAIVTGDWLDGAQSGDFGEERPGFRYELDDALWEQGEAAIQLVTVRVHFTVQGREHDVTLSTLAAEEASEQ